MAINAASRSFTDSRGEFIAIERALLSLSFAEVMARVIEVNALESGWAVATEESVLTVTDADVLTVPCLALDAAE